MKRVPIGIAVLCLLVLSGLHLGAEEGTGNQKPQTICPVMGDAINKEIFADYQGQRIYFCCKSCVPEFEKNPEKYLKQMESTGITLEKVPAPDSQQNTGDTHEKKSSSGCGCDCCS